MRPRQLAMAQYSDATCCIHLPAGMLGQPRHYKTSSCACSLPKWHLQFGQLAFSCSQGPKQLLWKLCPQAVVTTLGSALLNHSSAKQILHSTSSQVLAGICTFLQLCTAAAACALLQALAPEFEGNTPAAAGLGGDDGLCGSLPTTSSRCYATCLL